jgi:TetR/AcrR family transcriptional regulator
MRIVTKSLLGSRRRPEESRAAILRAAVREFANEGVSGARTDAIAGAAKVNKALLYYYFEDKEALYGAVLDQVFEGLTRSIHEALSRDLPPRQRILDYAGAHFDYIASNPLFPKIVQAEMMRAGRGRTAQFERIANQYFRPIFSKLAETLAVGGKTGEFRIVDPMSFIPCMISVIVFHFNSAPVMRIMTGKDPFSPESLAVRRAAVLDFISAALFIPINSNPSHAAARRASERTQ